MSRLPFNGLEVFLNIAEHGSLRRAADAMGVQPPAVSYQLKTLEERIGTALFVRTTRSIRLTDAGRSLLARAQPAITEISEAFEDARASGSSRKGTIRITLPYDAYQLTIEKRLAAFHTEYPEIELDLSFDEAFVDMTAEGFHAGVRLGDHIQEDMIAVRLSPPLQEVVFAAPSYISSHGRPAQPKDLLLHNCIRYRYITSKRFAEWRFHGVDGIVTIDVRGNLIVNSTTALLSAAYAGHGFAWLFRPSIEDSLQDGTLESVLDNFSVEAPGYFLYYPKANARIEAFRLFIDFMKNQKDAR